MNDELLLLGVKADGPYWMSALEVFGPPNGVSFHRAFDYRADWVHQNVLDRLEEGGSSKKMNALIGFQFRDDGAGAGRRFLPLRFADAEVSMDGGIKIDLVLRDYVAIDEANDDLAASDVPEKMNEKNGAQVLARVVSGSELSKLNAFRRASTPDHKVWAKLATSDLIPQLVRDRLRDRVVLYCTSIRRQKSGAVVPIVNLGSAGAVGTKRGYKLKVGETYNVELGMRRIAPAGEPTFPDAPDFEFLNDPQRILSSTSRVPFTGNYRSTSIWVRPQVAQDAPVDLWWHPRAAEAGGAPRDYRDPGLRLPVTSTRKIHWLFFALVLVLLAIGATLLIAAGQTSTTDKNQASAFIASGSVVISLGTALLLKTLDRIQAQG